MTMAVSCQLEPPAKASRPSTAKARQASVGDIKAKLARPVTASTTRKEIRGMKKLMRKLDYKELQEITFASKTTTVVPKQRRKSYSRKDNKELLSIPKYKTPRGAVRSMLQQPMERPGDCPPLVWKYFHDEMTRVATTPRERKRHMSTLGITDQDKRGMVLDGVAFSHGNGVERRFYR